MATEQQLIDAHKAGREFFAHLSADHSMEERDSFVAGLLGDMRREQGPPKERIELSPMDIVLIRCGLLVRMDNLKDRPEVTESYERSRALMNALYPLSREGKGATLLVDRDAFPHSSEVQ